MSTVFIIGTGRCGSTVLHELLARHPEVAFASNLDDRLGSVRWCRWNKPIFRYIGPERTKKGRPRFGPSEAYRAWARQVSPLLVDPCRDLTDADLTPWLQHRLAIFTSELGRRQRLDVTLHKFTGWPRARFLAAAMPAAQFVHVVRDGRAVANSFLQMPWWDGHRGPYSWHLGPLAPEYASEWAKADRSFVTLAAIAWKLLIDAFATSEAALPAHRWLTVRYEDLVADPQVTLAKVLGFMGLVDSVPYQRAIKAYELRGDRASGFRGELGSSRLEEVETSLGDHLERLGYG